MRSRKKRRRPYGKGRRPAGKGRRNLGLFGLVVLALAGLITFVGMSDRTPKRIMEPEPPEMTAKRESRESNAFYTMWEAAQMVPAVPHSLLVPMKMGPNATETYYAERGSVGDLLKIDRPDDDRAMALYVLSCRPAIEKLREALKQDYFLYPHVGTPHNDWMWEDQAYWNAFQRLNNVVVASMLMTAANPKHQDKAIGFFSDALQFGERIGADGSQNHHWAAVASLLITLKSGANAAHHIASPDALRQMLAAAQAVRFHERPLAPYLEFRWRTVDNLAVWMASGGFQGLAVHARLFESWMLSRQCRLLRKHKEELRGLVELSWAEFKGLSEESVQHLRGTWQYSYGALDEIWQLITARAHVENSRKECILLLNLELYQREHGAYPESLEVLVPGYIEKIPLSWRSDEPLVYEMDGDDYWLYPGPKRDDLRDMEPEARRHHVIHCPEDLAGEEEGDMKAGNQGV